ncbi:hypothetical protein IGI04_035862 [Brassica rapa subsp. trilocularis]|uniref:Uncharacterized protein n=1 Tax=Brassica rapa subsp. trilocularis TaxID=1813537 RepID=A0ABQ7LCU0_BRACM|nr:hypothetical protein IGI04_035862 [Brassica rapa subsp. trilocularis]
MNSDPRGLRTDGMNGDTKGCGIAQRYYQTSIVAGCDAPLDGKDKPQYGQIGHLAMVPAKAPFRTYVGLSSTLHGQSVRYVEKHEPRLKCSERSDLKAGSAPYVKDVASMALRQHGSTTVTRGSRRYRSTTGGGGEHAAPQRLSLPLGSCSPSRRSGT